MIFVKSKEKSAKNPAIDVEYYDLCIGELFQVVSTPAALQYINEIANKQRNKAIVFKKWNYFKQKSVNKNLKNAFRFISGAMDLLVKQATLLPSPSLNIETEWSNKQVQYFFDAATLGFFLWENARAALRQAPSLFSLYIPKKTCKSDAELSKWFNEQLNRVRNNYREILAQINMMEKQWKEDS